MSKGKRVSAVIGAGYGDEGKGLLTDSLAWRTAAPVVVRTNGGAQAGHTVTTPDGRRHVFSHIGSGAMAGAATHLSQFFVAHPMFFLRERDEVAALGGNVGVTIDPRASVTTPFDILVNQIVEESRGATRHGSCGMGFGETIERNLRPEVSITVADLAGSRLGLVSKLERTRRSWVGERLSVLGVTVIPERFRTVLEDDDVVRRFIDDCDQFLSAVGIADDRNIPDGAVFEGAQGLLLDQDYGAFPNVTRSNTGLANMVSIAKEADMVTIDAHFVTRAYVTRHGAGPLAHEGHDMSYAKIVDATNIHNDWQGSIRSAPLDLDILSNAIRHDIALADGVSIQPRLTVACLDQLDGGATVFYGGTPRRMSSDALLGAAGLATGLPVSFVSEGITRKHVKAVLPD